MKARDLRRTFYLADPCSLFLSPLLSQSSSLWGSGEPSLGEAVPPTTLENLYR